MIKVGNKHYESGLDLPVSVPVFPLSGALLLPGAQLPLNIFEPRYVQMIDESLASDRLIGIIQPSVDAGVEQASDQVNDLCTMGCLGRIVGYGETGDGRYMMTLGGVCRFRITGEVDPGANLFRRCTIEPLLSDLESSDDGQEVNRELLLSNFRAYLEVNNLEVDWKSVEKASNVLLVNSLSMMAPYGPAEKQALLEAADIRTRADTLIAITEMVLAKDDSGGKWRLQ